MQPTYDRPAARNQRRETVVQAVRRKCIDCSAGQPSEVRKCPVVACPLWPFRFGTNPFSRPRGSPFPTRSVSQKISPQTAKVSDGNGPPAEMEGLATTGDRASPGKETRSNAHWSTRCTRPASRPNSSKLRWRLKTLRLITATNSRKRAHAATLGSFGGNNGRRIMGKIKDKLQAKPEKQEKPKETLPEKTKRNAAYGSLR